MKQLNFLILYINAFFLIVPTSILAEKFVVTVDHLVKEIDEEATGCSLEGWGGTIDNTCMCCLLKKATSVSSGKISAMSVVDECLKKNKKCDEASLRSLKQRSGIKENDEEAFRKLIKYIYNTSIVVKPIKTGDVIFDKQGNFTPAALAQFFELAFKEGKLPYPEFKNAKCLSVRDMVEQKAEATWGTLQLFSMQSTCVPNKKSSYIIKEMARPIEEVFRLVRGEKSKDLEPFIFPNKVPGYPIFIFPISYLSYNYKGTKHQLALMNRSPGVQLATFTKAMKANPNDKAIIRGTSKAYFRLGVQLARFYKRYMGHIKPGTLGKTIIHGDLHYLNIFYDHEDIYFIDNERVANSIPNYKDISTDLGYLLMKSLMVSEIYNKNFLVNFPAKQWFEVMLPAFISGFLSTYPADEVKSIFHELLKRIESYKENTSEETWYSEKEPIKGFRFKTYMGPVLKAIEDSPALLAMAQDRKINEQDSHGRTILHHAAKANDALMMRPLIVAGADVNMPDAHGNTPLHDAAFFNSLAAMSVLIDAGADVKAKNKNGETPLQKAEYGHNKPAIDLLIKSGADHKKK